MLPKGREGAKQAIGVLRAKQGLGMLVDQKFNEGLPIPFFGRDAMTATAPADLSMTFGCPLVPVQVERLGGARFRMTVYPPITVSKAGDRKANVRALEQINALVEPEDLSGRTSSNHRRWPDEIVDGRRTSRAASSRFSNQLTRQSRCGSPVARPVAPTVPRTSPRPTTSPSFTVDRLGMQERGLNAVSVIQHQGPAREIHVVMHQRNDAVGRGNERRAFRRGDIDPEMRLARLAVQDALAAVDTGDDALTGQIRSRTAVRPGRFREPRAPALAHA